MQAARLVVLGVAIAAGGLAAILARGGSEPPHTSVPARTDIDHDAGLAEGEVAAHAASMQIAPAPTPDQAEAPALARQRGFPSLVLRNNAHAKPMVQDERAGINVVRYGVTMTTMPN